jgi:hypothetical protein
VFATLMTLRGVDLEYMDEQMNHDPVKKWLLWEDGARIEPVHSRWYWRR